MYPQNYWRLNYVAIFENQKSQKISKYKPNLHNNKAIIITYHEKGCTWYYTYIYVFHRSLVCVPLLPFTLQANGHGRYKHNPEAATSRGGGLRSRQPSCQNLLILHLFSWLCVNNFGCSLAQANSPLDDFHLAGVAPSCSSCRLLTFARQCPLRKLRLAPLRSFPTIP